MKRYLIPESSRYYKANLHCHTTVFDGRKTPAEIKALYTAHGYSIVAFTDHDVLIPHPELRGPDFLPLNGFEAEIGEPGSADWANRKQCHLCFIAKDPDNVCMPFYHRTKYIWGNAERYRSALQYDESQPDHTREYSHTCISDMIRRGREAGFFVTYNHPTWSREDYPDYIGYQGMDAMEIMNYGCCCEGYLDYNPRVYDDFLRAGRKLFCIAADDNHGRIADECGGWTIATCHSRNSRILQGSRLTEGSFPLNPKDGYIRLTVVDSQGRCADTNAYFIEDIL